MVLGTSEVVLGKSEVVLGKSEVVLGKSEVVLGKSEVVLGKSEVVLGKSEVVLGKSEVVLGKSKSLRRGENTRKAWLIKRCVPSEQFCFTRCFELEVKSRCRHVSIHIPHTSYLH